MDPIPADLRGEAFRLLSELLLLFPTTTIRDQFLTTMRKKKRQPTYGYTTDVCTTPPETPQSEPTSEQ